MALWDTFRSLQTLTPSSFSSVTVMCHGTCLEFVHRSLAAECTAGRHVLEVGSLDVNGSPRSIVEDQGPASYLGIDIVDGPGVDRICPAEEIVEQFGAESFDVIISTEMMEHVDDWRLILSNMKRALAPNGLLIVTTILRLPSSRPSRRLLAIRAFGHAHPLRRLPDRTTRRR